MQNVVKLFPVENPTALIDRSSLTEAVELLAKLCSASQPGTAAIRFSSEPGGIALAATNFTVMAETSLSADVDARFSAAIPAATLLKLLKKGGPSETIVLELHHDPEQPEADRFIAHKCTVTIGDTAFTVDATSTEDFPEPIRLIADERSDIFTIPAAVLWNAIDGTIGAVSTDEARYYLQGIYVHGYEGHLRFVATDGHKLYMQDTDIDISKADVAGIIPSGAARFIAALIDGHAGADPVAFEISPTMASAVYRDVAVTLKLVDGTFPDYLRVIPTDLDKTATVTGAVLDAAAAALTDCTGASNIMLTFTDDGLNLSAKGTAGEGSSSVPCVYEGEPFEIGFAAKNLRSIIDGASPDGRAMTFRMSAAEAPALVTGTIGGWTGVLMPVRL